jgi:GAF domain-containing protein
MVAGSIPARPAVERDAPARLCGSFVDALFVTGASISVFGRDGQQSTICATDSVAARGETLQFELGEGPHWEALALGLAVLAPDLSRPEESKWPMFSAAAQEIGMAAVFAFPMTMGAVRVGVVDLYCDRPRRLDSRQVSLAASMAGRCAATAVRQAMRSAEHSASIEQEKAPALRREVHQATGMIQVQLDVDATEAFTRMRAYSFTSGRPVADIASDIVNRRLNFSDLRD